MVTVVDIALPADQFALDNTFGRLPNAEFQTVRIVAHEAGHFIPFLWSSAPDLDALNDALKDDPTTETVRRLYQSDGRDLHRVEWGTNVRFIVHTLVEKHGTLMRARATNGRWSIRVLFPDRDEVSATYDACREYGIDLSILRVTGIAGSLDRGETGLSEAQYEALTAAFETDYYAVPRGMDLKNLADEIGVSNQALSERLRRGHQTLIANTLYVSPSALSYAPEPALSDP